MLTSGPLFLKFHVWIWARFVTVFPSVSNFTNFKLAFKTQSEDSKYSYQAKRILKNSQKTFGKSYFEIDCIFICKYLSNSQCGFTKICST